MNFCVVIPVYREELLSHEKISLRRINEVFRGIPKFLYFPENINVKSYTGQIDGVHLRHFDQAYFSSIDSYNLLLKSAAFYTPVIDFDYMLVYQLDSYIFQEEKIYDCLKWGYDYVGAPWLSPDWFDRSEKTIAKFKFLRPWINRVGNGGFSLRKVKTFHSFCLRFPFVGKLVNIQEDIFWSNVVPRLTTGFKLASIERALEFSFDEHPQECFSLNKQRLPFGCHGWQKNDYGFWKTYIKDVDEVTP